MASKRRDGRVIALQALYEIDTVDHHPQQTVDRWALDKGTDERVTRFAHELVAGVLQEREELDTLLQESAPLYPVDRIAPVDRAALRLALYELFYVAATPPKVAINEAIELAKEFGGDHSSRFVNGVLGNVMERHEGQLAARGARTAAEEG